MSKVTHITNPIRGFKALDLDNEEYGAIRTEQAAFIKQINSDMLATFSTEEGKRTLEVLRSWTIYRPACKPSSTERMDMFCSGQDDIIRCILLAMKNTGE